jgi:hypothetical protein
VDKFTSVEKIPTASLAWLAWLSLNLIWPHLIHIIVQVDVTDRRDKGDDCCSGHDLELENPSVSGVFDPQLDASLVDEVNG